MPPTEISRPGPLITRAGAPPRLLLAEDSPAARILTAALLTRMGAEVEAVEDGEQAVAAVAASHFDAAILDIEMPVMDGIAAARAIRALRGGNLPLIALSAFLADTAQSGHWRDLFDVTQPKPASRAGLKRAVSAALLRQPNLVALREAEPHGLIDESLMADIRAQFAPDGFRDMIGVALGEMRQSVAALHEALTRQDLPQAMRLAHKVKGIARSFAAASLAREAERLEQQSRAGTAPSDLKAGLARLETCLNQTANAFRREAA